jgi:parvulin-like peptidyl-prolyl isomerase
MPQKLSISVSDIIDNLKLACQIPSVVESIASQQIIAEAAQAAGIEVQEEELQEEGDKLRLEKKLVKAKDTWTWLEKHHLSVDDFEKIVQNNVLYQKLANHLFASHVEKFFYEHRLDYFAAAIYEVVFDDRDLALEVFYAFQQGEITFPEIARQYILEPELRRAGGYQGTKYRKQLRPEIAAAVFAAAPPGILKPITTIKGVHLIWVEEIIQPELDVQLRQKIVNELFTSWLEQQVESREIEIQLESVDDLDTQEKRLKQA